MCNWPSYKYPAKPAHWTPLMCLVDTPVVDNPFAHNTFADLVVVVIRQMDRRGLCNQASNTKSNFMHLLCTRGNITVVTRILSVFDQDGSTNLDKAFWISLLNEPDEKGKGCVDSCLGCRVEFTKTLKRFGVVE